MCETTRIEAFSDGVFAIAITLLLLEIRIDPSEFAHLRHALVDEWPGYLAYVTSFLTIGSLWIAQLLPGEPTKRAGGSVPSNRFMFTYVNRRVRRVVCLRPP
ncbi:MAG: TMEM175 family protein [Solirubrobacteraceae bacterium]